MLLVTMYAEDMTNSIKYEEWVNGTMLLGNWKYQI